MNPLFSHRPRKSPPLNRFLEEPIVVDRLSEGLVPSGLAEMAIALQLESTPIVEPEPVVAEPAEPQPTQIQSVDWDVLADQIEHAAQDPDASITIVEPAPVEPPMADPAVSEKPPIQYDLEAPAPTLSQIRGWDRSMNKADLLVVAVAKGCAVTEQDSKAVIVRALEAVTG